MVRVPLVENAASECPDLFPLSLTNSTEEKWVLVVNTNPGGYQFGSGARYFLGSFDGKNFTYDEGQFDSVNFIDHGADFYAVTSFFNVWNDPRSRTAIGWMSNW
jgi:sucrose-6-phosphate hydrolase SacC (GH32 family)